MFYNQLNNFQTNKSNVQSAAAPFSGSIPFESGFGKGLRAGGAIASSESTANEFMGAEIPDNNPFFNFNGQMVRGVIDMSGISDAEAAFRQNEVMQFRAMNPGRLGPEPLNTAGTPSNITINVNAPSIIDEEGFTRALNTAQNNSFFRGTGGATNLVGIG